MTTAATTTPAPTHHSNGMKLHRFIGKCRNCKTVNVRTDILGWTISTPCTGCGVRFNVKRIDGNFGIQECGAKCQGAIGPACDCKCGGENHGGKHG